MSEITTAEANARRNTATILDVREEAETAEGMIPGAVHIPLGQLASRLGELDAGRPVITVCASGNRSAHAAVDLLVAGFRADTMAGGMTAWETEGRPTHKP
ncbi:MULTISPECIES: rhodanese-like domain-containing protein [Actinomycetes]|uniref:Rhodanese-like domain-containing protein n=3 Tax=Micrococcaceae TaxID=1268 RepID=A0ABV0INW8_9MICC|nr:MULTISPECIES: rhodanese-like domain-containing protein [Actinomycetes]PZP28592.1 MAG: rhodanese-like domain-containing protein [Kocuria rhizophila]MBP2398582.1 rhodanese-related sulfurtransferase [Glutamicibacter protophormiae]MCT1802112.1 rhodanese-like domain-containing protein [Kocuria carniphila]MDN5720278.1 rhodanese-like domain-containing protein [Corynebacterium sp.]QZE26556.1 rhodanese-like domain-containing protein [Brevibacterium casei]